MATTPNYNFSTVADSEFEKNLIDWVRELAGTGDTSTLMIIDRILAEHENAIGTKQMAVAGTDVVATASGDISAGGMVYVLQEGTVSRYSFGAANEHILPSTNVFRLSPDKSFAVVGGGSQPYAQYYKVSGNVLTYLCDIPSNADGAELDGSVLGAAFSPDGTMLVLTGKFTGSAKLYHVDGETMTYVCDLYEDADNTAFTKTIFAAAFSPDGTVLVLAGTFAHGAKKYAVSGGQATYVDEIDADNDGTSLMNMVSCIAFSADGAYMAMGGLLELEYGAKLYSVSGGTFTFLGNSSIDGLVYDVAFSPDGSHLLVIGDQEGYANVYSVSASGLTHLYNLLDGVENGNARSAAFSADGKTLIITGLFGAKAFDVNAADIQYRFDFADYAALGGACAELPDGVSWVIGALKYGPAQTVYPAMDGIPGSMYQIGISCADIADGESGTVRIIAAPHVEFDSEYETCDEPGEEWTDAEKVNAWKRQAIIKTAMDEIAVAGAQYYLGKQTAVSIVLPDNAQAGQLIVVSWYNGDTAATLSITGTMLAFDYTPSANTRSEINALWDGSYWAVIGSEMEVPGDAETA